ncbi:MAG: pyridoxal kinase PdxY [Alphaproteobacteria bacterium]|nr:pyridoxal kinase PdxY [Alphaproteobacteria bacterium]MCW5740560.1 pyridoxal kinase PdxY [Alphaproteobacteria bacterium]
MRVLSIQSHVAYGYVGNRAATFPLQRLGHEVWAVNTVEFSNHTGYGAWKGRVAAPEQVRDVIAGIAERGALSSCDAILTGYMGDAALGEVVLEAVAMVRAANPRAVWCCDPVIGDIDRQVYVRPGIPEFFRDRIVALSDILTPNHFELEWLSGRKVSTLKDTMSAARSLMRAGPHPSILLVTSLRRSDAPAGTVEMLALTHEAAWLVSTPELAFPIAPNGTGDAVAALFLAHWHAHRDVGRALEEVAASIYAVLEATLASGDRELRLVTAQDMLVSSPRRFSAVQLDA